MGLFNKKAAAVSYEMKVEGMRCPHCAARVVKALTALPGVTADADVESKTVVITAPETLAADKLTAAVDATGDFHAVSIERK